ncbi:MAG: Hcp family type VI secretion system effector [Planctomycetota bacterium]
MAAPTESNDALDVFLKLDGIKGESTDAAHESWIEVLSYTLDVHQRHQGTGRPGSGPTGGSQTSASHLTIRKVTDAASAMLFSHCVQGSPIRKARLEVCEPAGDKHVVGAVDMRQVRVLSYDDKGVADEHGAPRPIEEIVLGYDKIEWEVTPIKHGGQSKATVKRGWDLKTNLPT